MQNDIRLFLEKLNTSMTITDNTGNTSVVSVIGIISNKIFLLQITYTLFIYISTDFYLGDVSTALEYNEPHSLIIPKCSVMPKSESPFSEIEITEIDSSSTSKFYNC